MKEKIKYNKNYLTSSIWIYLRFSLAIPLGLTCTIRRKIWRFDLVSFGQLIFKNLVQWLVSNRWQYGFSLAYLGSTL